MPLMTQLVASMSTQFSLPLEDREYHSGTCADLLFTDVDNSFHGHGTATLKRTTAKT
jgi:hypothetical protein